MTTLTTVVGFTVLWAALSTCVVMVPGIFLGYALARYEFLGKNVLSTLASLPLVLPPTAVGYLLLRLLAHSGPLGPGSLGIDLDILLDWEAAVLACSVMSMPLVVRTARVSFEAVDPRLEAMARTLGYSRLRAFIAITLPLAARGLTASMILGFTRAMGEFGATVTVAGNIPGQTQTLASAIYSAQHAGDEARANVLLIIALVVGFSLVFLAETLSLPRRKNAGGKAE